MPKPTWTSTRSVACAALLSGLIVAIPTAYAAPEMSSSAATALPQSSADLVGRLFANRGWLTDAVDVDTGAADDRGLLAQVRGKASSMVLTAMNFIGVPYRRGGTEADSGFDCSGFTRRVFESSVGLLLPRRADEQAKASGLKPVDRDALQPGDLVFFNTLRRTFSHVGIYVGDHKFIHSPRSGSEVRVDDLRFSYWARHYTGARRANLGAATDSADERGSSER